MHIQHVEQSIAMLLLELLHLLQVIRNPIGLSVLVILDGIVPILVRRLLPAAVRVRPGKQHASPAAGHRSDDERRGVHCLHRLRPLQIAAQHVGISRVVPVDVGVRPDPVFGLVIHVKQTHAARVRRAEAGHKMLHPLLREIRGHGHVGVVGIVVHRVSVQQNAVAAVGIAGVDGFLRAVFLHAEAAHASRANGPIHQGDGPQRYRAASQVPGVDLIEAGADGVIQKTPRVVARIVLDVGLPVVSGGIVAAPAYQRDAHQLHQTGVPPLVDAVYVGADRVNAGLRVDRQRRRGLRRGGEASKIAQNQSEERFHLPLL